MADLSQTAANVATGSLTCPVGKGTAGVALTQGMPIYQSSSDSKYYQCDANDTLAKAACVGIVLTPASTNGSFVFMKPSTTSGVSLVNLGATLAVGTFYAVSATKGAIAPIADITSTQFPTTIGPAISTSLLDFQVAICSVAKA